MKPNIIISDKMRRVNELLSSFYEGPRMCISQLSENIVVEVGRRDIQDVVAHLKAEFRDVVDIRKAYLMIDDLHDFILVKPMISESPVLFQDGICFSSLEKKLVDMASDKEFSSLSDSTIRMEYQKAFDAYDVNVPKMLRYASRKGEREQVQELIGRVDHSRVKMFSDIRAILNGTPVTDAWVFGSFSRLEETPESDIDILFRYDKSAKFSLLDHVALKLALENAIGREVDLVTDGTLLPFAVESANKDKYKIYERSV